MKRSNYLLAIILILGFSNCQNSPQSVNVEKDASELGSLQCKAQELRVKRFRLADDMRFADDSLRLFKKSIDPSREKAFDSLKVILATQTDQMSKKINQHLDSLWKNGYQEESQRKKLDAAVITYMNKNCPENK